MLRGPSMLTEIAGEFVRIVYADELALTLNLGDPAYPPYAPSIIPNFWRSIRDDRS